MAEEKANNGRSGKGKGKGQGGGKKGGGGRGGRGGGGKKGRGGWFRSPNGFGSFVDFMLGTFKAAGGGLAARIEADFTVDGLRWALPNVGFLQHWSMRPLATGVYGLFINPALLRMTLKPSPSTQNVVRMGAVLAATFDAIEGAFGDVRKKVRESFTFGPFALQTAANMQVPAGQVQQLVAAAAEAGAAAAAQAGAKAGAQTAIAGLQSLGVLSGRGGGLGDTNINIIDATGADIPDGATDETDQTWAGDDEYDEVIGIEEGDEEY